jgi:hypothetical protein
MLTRIASHVDILDAAEPSVRHQLVQALCQPFFEQAVETLCGEISSVGPGVSGATWQKTMASQGNYDKTSCSLGQGLGLLEETSTDENDSAFAALLSSEGEDFEGDRRIDWAAHLSGDEDSEPPRDDEKSQMVCRHWKSKGWCRYESKCKFMHPENKRGTSAKNPTESLNVPLPDRSTRRRGGKNKRNVVPLDSRLSFAESYNMGQPFALCQAMQEIHPGLY